MYSVNLHIYEIYNRLSCEGDRIFTGPVKGLHIVLEPGSKIQVVDQVADPFALP